MDVLSCPRLVVAVGVVVPLSLGGRPRFFGAAAAEGGPAEDGPAAAAPRARISRTVRGAAASVFLF